MFMPHSYICINCTCRRPGISLACCPFATERTPCASPARVMPSWTVSSFLPCDCTCRNLRSMSCLRCGKPRAVHYAHHRQVSNAWNGAYKYIHYIYYHKYIMYLCQIYFTYIRDSRVTSQMPLVQLAPFGAFALFFGWGTTKLGHLDGAQPTIVQVDLAG